MMKISYEKGSPEVGLSPMERDVAQKGIEISLEMIKKGQSFSNVSRWYATAEYYKGLGDAERERIARRFAVLEEEHQKEGGVDFYPL